MSTCSMSSVVAGEARWHVEHADSLAWLTTLPDECADAFITDPPYSSGGAFRGDRAGKVDTKYFNKEWAENRAPGFQGDNRDQRGFLLWCALWLAEALRATKPGGVIAQFCDWRQLPVTADALQAGGWVWRGVAVWDKTEAARPQRGRFRAQAEYLVWGSKGPLDDERGVPCLPGVFSRAANSGEKHHITAKPVGLMVDVVGLCVPSGLVVDPFSGSASTGVAALRTGRRFLGCEVDDAYINVARDRCAAEAQGLDLSKAAAGQTGLFQ